MSGQNIGDQEFMHLACQGNCVLVVQILIQVALKIDFRLQAATACHGLKGTWRQFLKLWEYLKKEWQQTLWWTHLNEC